MHEPVPVTLVTGFLGSGKTTLLNHILSSSHGFRVGVVLNEFGEISIDSLLIASRDEDVMELTNGCICCTVRDDLLRSIVTLLSRPHAPEHILIESTGLADPGPVLQKILDPRIQEYVRLDSIITLVDAANFDCNLEYAEQAYNQIVYGDILLVNKTDLVASEVLEQIEAGIRHLNPSARVIRCLQARIDLGMILGLGLFDPQRGPVMSGDHRSSHLHNFHAVSFRTKTPMDLNKFTAFLEELPIEVFRGKGVLYVPDIPFQLVFHLVGNRWTVVKGKLWGVGEERITEMVFIGKDLDREALRKDFLDCLEDSAS